MRVSLDLPVGTLLGKKYEICSSIWRGSLTTVYQGRDLARGRTVALKVLTGQPESVALQERHMSSTRIGSVLTDPGIVQVWGVHIKEDPSFIALEFVDGSNLSDLIGLKKLDAADLARLGASLCSTLAVLHGSGLVHANLEPANILVLSCSNVKVKLTDFGVAPFSGLDRLTSVRVPMSPERYRSPEVSAGRLFDQSADVYAAGQILIECLTGRLVLPAWPDEGPVRFDQSENPWIDPVWSDLLYAMTSVAPQDRPSASEAADEFDLLANQLGVTDETDRLPNPASSLDTDGSQPVLPSTVRDNIPLLAAEISNDTDSTVEAETERRALLRWPNSRRMRTAIIVFSEVLALSVLIFGLLHWVDGRAADGPEPQHEAESVDIPDGPGHPIPSPSVESWSDRVEFDGGAGDQGMISSRTPSYRGSMRMPRRPTSASSNNGHRSKTGDGHDGKSGKRPGDNKPSEPPPSQGPEDPEPSEPPPSQGPEDPEPSEPPPSQGSEDAEAESS